MGFRKKRGESEQADKSGSSLRSLLPRLISRILLGPPQQRLSYEDAIGWFLDHRPANGKVALGAVLRTMLTGGRTEIVQVFLDDGGHPVCTSDGIPYGRRFLVDELDEELAMKFGQSRLLIVH
jgi:hypothetical protein